MNEVTIDTKHPKLWIEKVNAQREEILALIMKHMGWTREKAMRWYRAENPFLGGISAERMVLIDCGHKVLAFIKSVTNGNFP